MGRSIRLVKIAGIPIEVNISWIFIFLLITYLLGDQFGHFHPAWPAVGQWGLAVGVAVAFFLSVLLHELSHSLVALRNGIPVQSITLFFFGGVSHLSHEARRPFTEFIVTVVGPLSSIFMALLFGGALLFLVDGTTSLDTALTALFTVRAYASPLEVTLRLLFIINLMLGLFNLLPGFPLDGGRVLRAVLWGISGSYWRATQLAARGGQAVGGLMVLGGIALAMAYFQAFGFSGAWLALIGAFLFTAATAIYRQERTKEELRHYRVSDVMMSNLSNLPGDAPLGSPSVREDLAGPGNLARVSWNGRVRGLLARMLLSRAPRDAWGYAPASHTMAPLDPLHSLGPEDSVSHALERMEASNMGRLAVTRNGEVLGFISREEVLRFARNARRHRT